MWFYNRCHLGTLDLASRRLNGCLGLTPAYNLKQLTLKELLMYQNFIGIDIGKDNFFVGLQGSQETHCFRNDKKGFTAFKKIYKKILSKSFVVLETTGGYELELIRYLQHEKVPVHRANTRKVKHYIRSFGVLGKTDTIDAKALAQYGADRYKTLEEYKESGVRRLQELVERRQDLKQMLVQEKNRLQAPAKKGLRKSFRTIIAAIEGQLKVIEKEIEKYCQTDPRIAERRKILETVDGVGKTISSELIALLPELGTLNRKKIASLAGVAPHPYESGKKIGYRSTKGGRTNVKKILFMAALTASRSKSKLGTFYNHLLSKGKKKMVALVALMRKILVVANARLREYHVLNTLNQHG
jgi:transposase